MNAPPVQAERPDLFRRVLLGAVTALIVARPLVAGEDPGRLRSPESISGIWINMFWIAAAMGGAVWLGRRRLPLRLGGWVPLALHATTAVVVLVTLAVSCYRHPGWLMTWEWATVAFVFLLVRTLVSDDSPAYDASGGILAAVMASAVSLAVYGLYQAIASKTGLPIPELAIQSAAVPPPDADFLGSAPAPAVTAEVTCRATFQRPDTLLALLVLTLPLFVVFARVSRDLRKRLALVTLALPVGAALLALFEFSRGPDAGKLLAEISTAWRIFTEHPILGVGLGNFDRFSPRLQPAELPDVLADGGSAYFTVLATGGVLLFAAVIASIAVMLVQAHRATAEDPPQPTEEEIGADGPRWEFYLGGVVGLLIGLILRLIDHPAAAPANVILQIGVGALIRAVTWFVAFALFEATAWRTSLRRRAIVIGIALVALFGLVSPAPLLPAVLQPLIVLAALATTRRLAEVSAPRLRWAPVPVLFVVAVVYLFLVVQPANQSATGFAESRRAERHYATLLAKAEAASGPSRSVEQRHLVDYLDRTVLTTLNDARQADPLDIAPTVEWAQWYLASWRHQPTYPKEPALEIVQTAKERDPHGTALLLAELQLRLEYARFTRRKYQGPRPKSEQELNRAIDEWRATQFRESRLLIEHLVARDPALEARLRFRLAQTLLQLNDFARANEGRDMARRVWELEQNAPGPRSKLTREQRSTVRRWLRMPIEPGERVWLFVPVNPGFLGGTGVLVPITAP